MLIQNVRFLASSQNTEHTHNANAKVQRSTTNATNATNLSRNNADSPGKTQRVRGIGGLCSIHVAFVFKEQLTTGCYWLHLCQGCRPAPQHLLQLSKGGNSKPQQFLLGCNSSSSRNGISTSGQVQAAQQMQARKVAANQAAVISNYPLLLLPQLLLPKQQLLVISPRPAQQP